MKTNKFFLLSLLLASSIVVTEAIAETKAYVVCTNGLRTDVVLDKNSCVYTNDAPCLAHDSTNNYAFTLNMCTLSIKHED